MKATRRGALIYPSPTPGSWRRCIHRHALFARHGLTLDEGLGYLDERETRRWESLSRATGGLLYALFGQNKRPIEIQRSLGLRALQNSKRMPHALAAAVEKAICVGAPVDRNANENRSRLHQRPLMITLDPWARRSPGEGASR